MVLIDDPKGGFVLGFLTKEFTLVQGGDRKALLAVYVPTNHLHFGDVRIFSKSRATYPDLTVQEGVRIFLTAGTAFSESIRAAGEAAQDAETGATVRSMPATES